MLFELIQSEIPQCANVRKKLIDDLDGSFARCPPLVVFSGRELMSHHRVTNDQKNVGRQFKVRCLQRSAIEHQRTIRPAEARNKLIHDAAAGTRVRVLCSLTQSCQFAEWDCDSTE